MIGADKNMITNKNVFKFEARQNIYDFILKNPGLHLRELSRRTNIPYGTLLHHLKYLKRLGVISEKNEKGYLRIYTQDNLGTRDKEILGLLRQKIPCRIILFLFFNFSFSRKELTKELNESPATLTYYINKLLEMNVIEEAYVKDGKIFPFPINPQKPLDKQTYIDKRPQGREKFYRRKNQQVLDKIYKLLITHKNSLADKKLVGSYLQYYKSIKKLRNYGQKTPLPLKVGKEEPVYDFINDLIRPFFAF